VGGVFFDPPHEKYDKFDMKTPFLTHFLSQKTHFLSFFRHFFHFLVIFRVFSSKMSKMTKMTPKMGVLGPFTPPGGGLKGLSNQRTPLDWVVFHGFP
jgi:hypothetical protein